MTVNLSAHPAWNRIQRLALCASGAGLLLFVVVGLILYGLIGLDHMRLLVRQCCLSYLVAYLFWLGIALGCLAILMLQHLTGGSWARLIRQVLEASAGTLLLLAVMFIPILLGARFLYLWAQPDLLSGDPELQNKVLQKSIYLNIPFFLVRAVGYFAIWLVLAYLLIHWSIQQERDGAPTSNQRFRNLSGPGLVLYGGTITFASVDWAMSLEPAWYSTIYPVLFATGQVLSGMAFAIAILLLLASYSPISELLDDKTQRDLGNLLLTFVMFWAYMSISQFILIWVGNLPEEIPWYLRRTRGGWQGLALLLIVCHFTLPFLLLLSRDVKASRRTLAAVAIGLLVMRFVDLFWRIEPAYTHDGQYIFWLLDIAAVAGLGGVWVWRFIGQLKQRPLLHTHAPNLAEDAAS